MNTKISDAQQVLREMEAGAVQLLPDPAPSVIHGWAKRLSAHLAADAVPVGHVRRDSSVAHMRVNLPEGTPLYTHPQPAALKEVSGNSGELGALTALAAKWRAQAATNEVNGLEAGSVGLTGAAMRHEARQHVLEEAACELEAALAATGKQQGGEVQVSPMAKMAEALRQKAEGERAEYDRRVAARQPVGQEPVGMVVAYPERGGHTAWAFTPSNAGWAHLENVPSTGGQFADQRFDVYAATPAQGIDLGQFRDLIGFAVLNAIYLPESDPRRDFIRQANELLALIDSRPTLANVTPPRDLRTQLPKEADHA